MKIRHFKIKIAALAMMLFTGMDGIAQDVYPEYHVNLFVNATDKGKVLAGAQVDVYAGDELLYTQPIEYFDQRISLPRNGYYTLVFRREQFHPKKVIVNTYAPYSADTLQMVFDIEMIDGKYPDLYGGLPVALIRYSKSREKLIYDTSYQQYVALKTE
ncbi:MAG: hypothetical protein Kow0075_16170 [Salibacteraceae bacterium]